MFKLPLPIVSYIEWFLQLLYVGLVVIYPWFLPLGAGWRAFSYPLFAGFLWGIWHVAYFDLRFTNDTPGFGYFITAFVGALIARLLYGFRCVLRTGRYRPPPPIAPSVAESPDPPKTNTRTPEPPVVN